MNNAEILCVGTELLLGEVVNTDAAYIARALASHGINVFHQSTVGDNEERLVAALEGALRRADLVVTSGGLGPTYDDLTKETIAKVMDAPLTLCESELLRIENYFKSRGLEMSENNKKQAYFPRGAEIFINDRGTASGAAIYNPETNKTVIMLPGPPRELFPMVDDCVCSYLAARTEFVMKSRNINIFGIGEAATEQCLSKLMRGCENPSVAPYCKDGEVRLRVTARAESEEQCFALCDSLVEKIKSSEIGKYIYGIDESSLESLLCKKLLAAGMTLGSAESLTGGMLAKRIVDIPGASRVFCGGVVSYSNEIKQNVLGVRAQTLEKFSAVSRECAVEMAAGARELLGCDIALSLTGFAGPKTNDGEEIGLVYIGIASKRGVRCEEIRLGDREREYIRYVAASHAISLAISETEV